MLERIIIGGIVVVLLAIGIRKFWRVSSGKDNGGCSGCSGCNLAEGCPSKLKIDQPDQEAPKKTIQAENDKE